jgi:hypothetical protein
MSMTNSTSWASIAIFVDIAQPLPLCRTRSPIRPRSKTTTTTSENSSGKIR